VHVKFAEATYKLAVIIVLPTRKDILIVWIFLPQRLERFEF
jgi:hypothetical protein